MRSRLGTLATLYVTQYLGIGFITIGLTGILREGGTSLDTLALLQFIGLIWPMKFLWAPLLDRYGSRRHGHYRSWLLVLQGCLVLTLLALVPFTEPSSSLGAIVLICAGYVFFSATQDIAVDAVAVRLLSEHDRGLGNGLQVSASYLGNLLGGGACVVIYDRFGWVPAILLLATLTAIGLFVTWRFREPPRIDRLTEIGSAYRALVSVLDQPGCRQWTFGVVPPLYIGAGVVYALLTPALVDAGWTLERIGFVTALVASAPAIAAGLIAGKLISAFGHARVLITGGVLLAASIASLLPLFVGKAPVLGTVLALCLFMAAYTVANVVLYTVNMDYSRPETGGTDFTVLSSFALICSFLAAALGLTIASRLGYAVTGAGSIALISLGVVLGVRHQRRYRQQVASTPPVRVSASEPVGR